MPFTRALSANPEPQLQYSLFPPLDNPYQGHYASLLYFSLPLGHVFQDIRVEPFAPNTFDWLQDAGVHAYIEAFFGHLSLHLNNDPTAAFDDPLTLQFCASASRIGSALRTDPSFRLNHSALHWWLDLGTAPIDGQLLFAPVDKDDPYPHQRTANINLDYSWAHRVRDLPFANRNCPSSVSSFIDVFHKQLRIKKPLDEEQESVFDGEVFNFRFVSTSVTRPSPSIGRTAERTKFEADPLNSSSRPAMHVPLRAPHNVERQLLSASMEPGPSTNSSVVQPLTGSFVKSTVPLASSLGIHPRTPSPPGCRSMVANTPPRPRKTRRTSSSVVTALSKSGNPLPPLFNGLLNQGKRPVAPLPNRGRILPAAPAPLPWPSRDVSRTPTSPTPRCKRGVGPSV